jgi:hypothetical protein
MKSSTFNPSDSEQTVFELTNSAREVSRTPQLDQEIADYHGGGAPGKSIKYKMIRSFLSF